MSQLAAITTNINWHVAMYEQICPVALILLATTDEVLTTPTAVEYRDALMQLYLFRMSVYGVKIPSDNNPNVQLSIQMVGWAAWITQAIFIDNCIVVVADNEFSFREVTFAAMNQQTFAQQVLQAWRATTNLSVVQLPPAPLTSNDTIRNAVRNLLGTFNPPAAPVGNIQNNTFLYAGTNPGVGV